MQQTVLSLLAVMALVGLSGWLAPLLPRVPLALLQIALGAAAGWPAGGLHVQFHPEVFMLLFIPPMLFADGWQMPQREFGSYRRPILLLSTVFVCFNVWAIGGLIHLVVASLPQAVCYLLAAVLSPTDPVAVSALLLRHRVPPKLRHILEGESLMNDAAALIAVKFAIAAVATGVFALPQALGAFAWTAAGGVAVGVAFGLGLKLAYDRLWPEGGEANGSPAVLLMLLAPFAPYLLAEHFGLSGVLAVVAGGMTANALQVRSGRFSAFRLQAQGAWATLLFALNGLVFTLVGLQLPALLRALPQPLHGVPGASARAVLVLLGTAVLITLALALLRFVTVLASGWIARRARGAPRTAGAARPCTTAAIVALGGTRGGFTLALVLGVPLALPSGAPFPARGLLVFLSAAVIVLTMLLAGLALPWLTRRLGPHECDRHAREAAWARRRAALAARRALAGIGLADGGAPVFAAALERVDRGYLHRLQLAGPRDAQSRCEAERALDMEAALRLGALQAERDELHGLRRHHRINDETLRRLTLEIDLVEAVIRNHQSALALHAPGAR